MISVFIKKGKIWAQIGSRGECHANLKAEIRVKHLQAKEAQGLLATCGTLRGGNGTDSPLQTSEGADLDSGLLASR